MLISWEILASELLPTAYTDVAALATADIPKGAYLRKLSQILNFGLTVALPDSGGAAADRLSAVLEFSRAAGSICPRFQLEEAGQSADLHLAVPLAVIAPMQSGFFRQPG